MYGDAETVAGAGRDVRRCSDALGPRKNLYMQYLFYAVPMVALYQSQPRMWPYLKRLLGPNLPTPNLCIFEPNEGVLSYGSWSGKASGGQTRFI